MTGARIEAVYPGWRGLAPWIDGRLIPTCKAEARGEGLLFGKLALPSCLAIALPEL